MGVLCTVIREKLDRNLKSMTDFFKTCKFHFSVANLEEHQQKKNRKLPSRSVKPMSDHFVPELDSIPELNSNGTSKFQELIGILRWATKIGRVDILTEISMLSSYQAVPRQGHLEQVYHMFAYLKHKPKLTLYFNPELPNIDPI